VTLIIAALLAPFILLTFCFGLEVFTGLRPLHEIPIDDQRASAVVIVPAHNEGAILADRLARLKDAVGESARILVVADNCSDSTADIARSLAVEVIERNDDERRGKGFALDFAKRSLLSAPPAVVLIVDADCMIDGASITRLINRCVATQSPCQATNLQAPALQASPAVQLSTFAFFIKNVIRQRALQRLAGRVHLLGTGMALPWSIFERSDLATSSIVEDLKLGQELAQAGHAPKFIEDATIWSNAETERNTLSQRSRWEGGFLQNGLSAGPK
jgi:glycosyltransferase involved in cell wall biosynthesis